MKLGFIGLGKMGLNMTILLKKRGHSVIGYDVNPVARKLAKKNKIATVDSLEDLVEKLDSQKIIWIMAPSGGPTEDIIYNLSSVLKKGDIIIDGGNSYYKDSVRRWKELKRKGIDFVDVGTSGGIIGAKVGYCLMIGAKKKTFKSLEPIFKALSYKEGYLLVGEEGSGHFVKMVHNGIEYGLMQSYAEGFNLMFSKKQFNLNLEKIAKLWNRGSIIRSFLLELSEGIFKNNPLLKNIEGYIEDSGEGRWTVQESIESAIPTPVIALSLINRFYSRNKNLFSAKVIASLRNAFGGHRLRKKRSKA